MHAGFRVDKGFLGRGDAVGDERGLDRYAALDQRQGDRTKLVVARGGADATDHLAVGEQIGADSGQLGQRSVELEPYKSAWRPAQVVHARDRLLAAVAALVERDGR